MIAGGFSAIILFQGFVGSIEDDLQGIAINTQYGHLQIATEQFWEKSAENPRDALIKDHQKIIAYLKSNPHVTYATGRLTFGGLIGTRDRSVTAMGLSFDVAGEKQKIDALRIKSGNALSEEKPYAALLGSSLASKLGVKNGESVNILAYTYDGVINAIELDVSGQFTTGLSELDENTFVLPLQTAQRLQDTGLVEKIIVGLDSTALTDDLRLEFARELQKIDPSLRIKTWFDLAQFFRELQAYYHAQNIFLEVIILSLVLLGILNTVGMAVFERTGEIGTIRSMGYTRHQVIAQFVTEGALLGLTGAFAGVFLSIALSSLVNVLEIPLIAPGATGPFPIYVGLSLAAFQNAALLTITSAVIAAAIPAFRASKVEIVEALKHNI
ncbi:MAG: hypothetical protein A2X97_13475 [Bdellovibrionales bacterium GWA1_52_35]|nr:MAG: hypothetical protein A2X97_13475 [Bdellovibrionales bacterium GWA1_52_35]